MEGEEGVEGAEGAEGEEGEEGEEDISIIPTFQLPFTTPSKN